ncbi:MAG: hypothetical protein ACLP7P_00945 [Rhodomicrobium sp.]
MRKTHLAICATAALGLCLMSPIGASAFPAADSAGKAYTQTVTGNSPLVQVRAWHRGWHHGWHAGWRGPGRRRGYWGGGYWGGGPYYGYGYGWPYLGFGVGGWGYDYYPGYYPGYYYGGAGCYY